MQNLIIVAVLLLIAGVSIEARRHNTINLPDYKGPELSQYTGYITVNEETSKALFYWLIESESVPDKDPLVVWFNGGPGCSSLIGLFTENGPFRPDMNGGLEYNNLGWTQFANMLYIEAPAGVGFSYSNTSSDYDTNDLQTAEDNYKFLSLFLEKFPQYAGRDTWITGESYAGVYIPTLTQQIFSNVTSPLYQQLTGIGIGNPVISCRSADYLNIQFNMFYWHGLVSYSVYASWISLGCDQDSSKTGCEDIFQIAVDQIGVIYQQKRADNEPSLDPDDLYQDFCSGNGTLDFSVNMGCPGSCAPVGQRMAAYLNRQDVQDAIGVISTTWLQCTSQINYNMSGASMIPLYQSFFAQNPAFNVLIYSGDVDIYTVPFGFTKACLAELQSSTVATWQPWFVNTATAGYVEVFEHYTYATIKGAGHEAPQYQTLTSLNMMQRFIEEQSLTARDGPSKMRSSGMTEGRMIKKLGVRV